MQIAIGVLTIITIFIFALVYWFGNIQLKKAVRLFIGGSILLILLNVFLYSIGKSLTADFFFFELRIVGKNGLEDIERNYLNFIQTIGTLNPILHGISFLIAPALVEEVTKLFVLVVSEKKAKFLRNTSDAVFSLAFIAIGFAYAETIFYLVSYAKQGTSWVDLTELALFRSLLSTASHIVFSGIVGFFYGRAMFAGYTIIDHGGITKFNRMLKWVKKLRVIPITSIKGLYQTNLIIWGLGLAVPIHIVYNYSLHLRMPLLAYAIIVVSGGWFFWYTKYLEKRECNYRAIDNRIGYLAAMKHLRKKREEMRIGDDTEGDSK